MLQISCRHLTYLLSGWHRGHAAPAAYIFTRAWNEPSWRLKLSWRQCKNDKGWAVWFYRFLEPSALVGAFSVIVKLREGLFPALIFTLTWPSPRRGPAVVLMERGNYHQFMAVSEPRLIMLLPHQPHHLHRSHHAVVVRRRSVRRSRYYWY